MWLLALLLAILAAAPAPAHARTLNESNTVIVAERTMRPVILQSLIDPAIEGVVFSILSFSVTPEAWVFISLETPYVMNVPSFTILSNHTPTPTVLDWQYLDEKIVMRAGQTFDLNNLVLINARKLGTFSLDVFINSPGAVLQVHNSTFVDHVCNATTPAEDLAAAQAMPQLPQRPRNSVSASPLLCVQLPTGRECFEHGVRMQELAVVMATASRPNRDLATSPAQAAAAAAAGNFVVQFRNTTHVCRKYLDAQCLQENGGNRELCWQQAAGTAAGQGVGQGVSPGGIAGAVIGGVVGLLAVLAAVLLYLRRRRRKRQHAGATKANAPGGLLDGAAGDPSTVGELSSPGRSSQQDSSGRGLSPLQQVQASGTVAGVGSSFGRDGLQLGVLLGFGSFGRVFQGRWHGKDVAIKIIHCQPEQLSRVLREAEIMLQLDHPNVVRALKCIVQHKPHSKPGDAKPGSSSTGTKSIPQTPQAARPSSGGGGGSSGDSSCHKHSSASSVSAMLPVLQKDGSAGSGSSSKLQAERPGSSSAGASNLSDSAATVADQIQTVPRQQPRLQQELQVVPVLATETPASSSSPDRPFQQQQQQQQQQPRQQQEKQQQDGSSPYVEGDEGFEAQVAEVWLVLELCSGGNLQDSFRQRNDAFNMPRLLCRLAEVAQGMAYLHSRNICHGDLKAPNVLLANSIHSSFGQIAKLTDFGFAGVLREGVTHHSTQNLGTISHCAPEVLQSGRMSPAADVYAFAILMWELLTASTAFKGVHAGTVIQQVVLGGARPPLPPDAPEDYALLMEACWAAHPSDRPSFDQILQCLTIMLASLETANTNCSNAMEDVLQQQQQRSTDAQDPDSVDAAGAGAAAAAAAGGDVVVETGGAAAAAAGAAGSVAGGGGTTGPVQQQQQQRPLGSYQVGSFDMCRAASSSSGSQGVSLCSSSGVGHSSNATPGLSRLYTAASASTDLAPAVSSPAAGSGGGAGGGGAAGYAHRSFAAGSVLLGPLTDTPAAADAGVGSGGSSSSAQRALQGGSHVWAAAGTRTAPVAAGGVVLQGCGLPGSAGSAGSAASAGSSRLSELRLLQQSHHIQDL